MEHAAAARARIGEQLAQARRRAERSGGRSAARPPGARRRGRARSPRRATRWTRCTSIAPRATRSCRSRGAAARRSASDVRTREHELAGVVARLKSLEELDAARAEYGDGRPHHPRGIGRRGAAARVGRRLRRRRPGATSAPSTPASGDLLQHVVVRTHADAARGPAVRPRAQRRPRRLRRRRRVGPEHRARRTEHAEHRAPDRHLVRVSGPRGGCDPRPVRRRPASRHRRDEARTLALETGGTVGRRSTAKCSTARIASRAARATKRAAS